MITFHCSRTVYFPFAVLTNCLVAIKGSREAGKEAVSGLVREDKDPHRAVRQGGLEETQGQSKRTGGCKDGGEPLEASRRRRMRFEVKPLLETGNMRWVRDQSGK